MFKRQFTIAILILSLFCFFELELKADTPRNIYTPRGTLVGDSYERDELDESTREDLDDYYASAYPNATQLTLWGEEYSSSRKYNCHGYAWYMIGDEEINDPVWIGCSSAGQTYKYWQDMSYSEVPVQYATHVDYSGDHSAITTDETDIYISKWNMYPLMRHHKNYHPGYGVPDKFLKRNVLVPQDYTSVQTAINNAEYPENVILSSDTYSENITMESGVDLVGVGEAGTFIDGSIYFSDVSNVSLFDLTAEGNIYIDDYSEDIDIEHVLFFGTLGVLSEDSEVDIRYCSNYMGAQGGSTYPVRSYEGSDVLLHCSYFRSANPGFEAAYYSTGDVTNTEFCDGSVDIDATSGYPSYNSYVDAMSDNTFSDDPNYTCLGNVDYPSSGYQICGAFKQSIADIGLSKSSAEEPFSNPDLRNNPEYQDFIEALDRYYAIRIKKNEAEESGQPISTESHVSDYETIIEKLKQFINDHSDEELAGTAMRLIGTVYLKLNRPEEIVDYVNSVLIDSKLEKVEWHAKKLLLTYYIKQNNTQLALALADELIEEAENEDLKCLILYRKGSIYTHTIEDQIKAAACFEEIIKEYPDSPIAQLAAAQIELLNMEPGFEKSGPSPLSEEGDLALTNYPNPSNPETTIHFRLPEKDRVTLKIFDIRGREVQTLLDREMDSGEQRIIWDGKDSMGNVAASGIYFYQIQFRDKVLTKKMTLIR